MLFPKLWPQLRPAAQKLVTKELVGLRCSVSKGVAAMLVRNVILQTEWQKEKF